MAIEHLTAETFDAAVERGLVLVELWAPWCGPCRAFAPTFEAAAARHPDAVFAKVNTDAEEALAGELGVESIPMLLAFRDGFLVFAQAGALSGAALDALVARLEALDMAAVRRELAGAR